MRAQGQRLTPLEMLERLVSFDTESARSNLPLIAFVIISLWLGLYVGAVLYLFFTMVLQGGYRPLFALAVALGTAVVMRLVFPMWFKVPLLTGPLEAVLGLY